MNVWKSDETLLSICILNFSFKNDFVLEEISNIRHSVSSPDETPRSSSKILRCASYFQLCSRCFFTCAATGRLHGTRMQILLQIVVMFAAKNLARFCRYRVNERRTRASFHPFKNLSGPV